jgi:hypothetical protein
MEIRRSPLRWWLPVLIALDVAMLFLRSTWWIGIWPEASAAAQLPAYFFGIVLGGGAAWAAGRVHRSGTAEQLAAAALPRWRIESLVLAATLAYGLAAYVPGVVLAALVSMPEAGPGFLWPSYLALGLCLVVLSAATGHLAGKLWASRFVPPVVVAICLFGQTMIRPIRMYVLSGHPQVELAVPAFTARVALTLLFVLLAVALPPRLAILDASRTAYARLLRPMAAGGVVACLGLVITAGPMTVLRHAPARPLCSSGTHRVCVWPEDRKYLGPVTDMVSRLADLPGNVLTLPPTFYEAGLRDAPRMETGADFRFLDGAVSVPSFLSSAVLNTTLPLCDVPQGSEERFYHEIFSLDAYLQIRALGDAAGGGSGGGPPGVDMREIRQVAARSDSDQSHWVADRLAAIRTIGRDCHAR